MYNGKLLPQNNDGYDNHSPQEVVYCAHKRVGESYHFKHCSRIVDAGVYPFCIYMNLETKNDSGLEDYYDCVDASILPHQCVQHGEYVQDFWEFTVRDKVIKGSLFCCSDNYCNALHEPIITMIRLGDHSNQDTFRFVFNSFLALIVASCAWIYISYGLRRRRLMARRRREQAMLIFKDFMSPVTHFIQEVYKDVQVQMRFTGLDNKLSSRHSSFKQMQKIISNTKHPWMFETVTDSTKTRTFISPIVISWQASGDKPMEVTRTAHTTYHHLLHKLIEQGPYRFDFNPVELSDLFDSATDIFAREPSLLEIPGRTMIVGCLNGDYGSLFRWFHVNGWPPSIRVLFLGGLTSTESDYSLETLALILSFKRELPNHVYILRGAAEAENIHIDQNRFSRQETQILINNAKRAFSYMPLAAVVADHYFCCHGLSSATKDHLDEIKAIARPIVDLKPNSLAAKIVMSQPFDRTQPMPDLRGKLYDAPNLKVADNFSLVIRARNPVVKGYAFVGNTLTLWSAPGFSHTTAGAIGFIDARATLYIRKLWEYGTVPKLIVKNANQPLDGFAVQEASRPLDRKMRKKAQKHRAGTNLLCSDMKPLSKAAFGAIVEDRSVEVKKFEQKSEKNTDGSMMSPATTAL